MAKNSFAKTGVLIREDQQQDLGSLGAGVAILLGTKLNTNEPFRMLKSEISISLRDVPLSLGEHLIFGLANGDLSVADIKEAIEISGPLSPSDRDKQEAARRFVKLISLWQPPQDGEVRSAPFMNDTGGPIITIKPRWTFGEAEGWVWFIYNAGVALTGTPDAVLRATHYGVWV